jgi:hypothetical protein
VTCHDVREQLSALLDDALSTPERAALDAHLATCAECRGELEQLRGTVALLGRLGPVHAPAGFVDRVVTQVYRPSRTRRLLDALFRPLRVKLPFEAAAVLLVGVAALYVYERTPEVQQAARQKTSESAPAPAPPVPAAPPVKGMAGKAPQPETAAPTQLGPAEGDVARERTAPMTPPAGTPAPPGTRAPDAAGNAVEAPGARADAKPEPMSDLRSEGKSEAKKEAEVTQRSNDSGAAPSPAKVEGLAKSIEPSPSRDAAPPQATAPPSSSGAALRGAAPAPPSEASRRTGGLSTTTPAPTASEGVVGDTAATAKSRAAAARLMRAADASGRLVVRESEPAEVALDALLSRLGATRVARRIERTQGPILIDVNVPAARYHELLEGLGHIGRWTSDHEPKTLPPQVRVEVAVSVER